MTMVRLPDNAAYDVLVAGGGTAGVPAAIQAARAGARTLLVEKNGMLGGTLTVAGVAWPGLFHAWGRQVIAGIGWDLVRRCVAEAGGSLPDFAVSPKHHAEHQVRLNPALYAALADEAVLESGADLLLHAMIASATRAAAGWTVALATKTGLRTVTVRVLVDATGDANLASLAGAPIRTPPETQPASLRYRADGYDPAALDLPALQRVFDEAVGQGRLRPTDVGWNVERGDLARWLRGHGGANHMPGIQAADSEGKTVLELAARRAMLGVYRLLRGRPGLAGLTLSDLAMECGVRETVTIAGQAIVTLEDVLSGRLRDDALCYAFYPIDLHVHAGSGLDKRPLPQGVIPSVPRGALLPEGVPGLIVAGRCLSSDRLANSALRVQAACMATGQAAGALAALSAASGLAPDALPLGDVRDLLRRHGAIVPPDPPPAATPHPTGDLTPQKLHPELCPELPRPMEFRTKFRM